MTRLTLFPKHVNACMSQTCIFPAKRVCSYWSQPSLNTNIIGNSPIPVAVAIALNANIIGSSLVAGAGAIALNTNIIGASRSTPDVKVQRARGSMSSSSMNDISTSTLWKSTSSANPLSQRPPPNVRSELAETNRWLHATLCSPLLLVISN